MDDTTDKLVNVNLDATLSRTFSADVDHERKVAIYDLLESNTFKVKARIPVHTRSTYPLTGPGWCSTSPTRAAKPAP
jgi:uncharacterized protein (UPF0262 family)